MLLGKAQEQKKTPKYQRVDTAVRQEMIGQKPSVQQYHARWEERDDCTFDHREPTQKSDEQSPVSDPDIVEPDDHRAHNESGTH